jgi:hypothetical protein
LDWADERYVISTYGLGGVVRSERFPLEPPCARVADTEHWIYFIQGDDGGPVKIGRSRLPPEERVAELQIGYPFGALRVVALTRGPGSLETALHRHFAASRMRGEWFRLSADLIGLIATIKALGPWAIAGKGAS